METTHCWSPFPFSENELAVGRMIKTAGREVIIARSRDILCRRVSHCRPLLLSFPFLSLLLRRRSRERAATASDWLPLPCSSDDRSANCSAFFPAALPTRTRNRKLTGQRPIRTGSGYFFRQLRRIAKARMSEWNDWWWAIAINDGQSSTPSVKVTNGSRPPLLRARRTSITHREATNTAIPFISTGYR